MAMVTLIKPPSKVVQYDFSYSRSTERFRWRWRDQEWLCDGIAGEAWCRRAVGETGHLILVCELSIDDDGEATAWAPEGELLTALKNEPIEQVETVHPSLADFPQGHDTHWRMCYYRAERLWRLRDERTGVLYLTNGYRGLIKLNWMDRGPHVFADQPAWIDENGIARFGE